METIELHLLSKDKSALGRASRAIDGFLERKGIDGGPGAGGFIHSQSRSEFRSVVEHGNEPRDKKDNWMKDVFRSSLELVDEQAGNTIYHTHINFQARIDVDAKTVTENIDLPDNVVVQKSSRQHSPYQSGNTPFSYDPSRSYYTEPENY